MRLLVFSFPNKTSTSSGGISPNKPFSFRSGRIRSGGSSFGALWVLEGKNPAHVMRTRTAGQATMQRTGGDPGSVKSSFKPHAKMTTKRMVNAPGSTMDCSMVAGVGHRSFMSRGRMLRSRWYMRPPSTIIGRMRKLCQSARRVVVWCISLN